MTDKELDDWEASMREYIRAYIDDYAGNVRARLTYIWAYRNLGVILNYPTHRGFPSFKHWEFNKSFNRGRFGYSVV